MLYLVNSLSPSPLPTKAVCACPDHKRTTEFYYRQQYILLFLSPFLPLFPPSLLFLPHPFDFFTLIQPRVNRTFPFLGHFQDSACTSPQGMHFKRRTQIPSDNDTNYSRLFYVKCTSSSISCALLRRKEEKRSKSMVSTVTAVPFAKFLSTYLCGWCH